jgi:micrococcal nuclease
MTINRRKLLCAAALLTAPPRLCAAAPRGNKAPDKGGTDGLSELGVVEAATVLSGDRLKLPDGREARLAVIEAAAPPADAAPGRRWPAAEAAQNALAAFIAGRRLQLWGQSAEPDRHGRLTAHVRRDDDGTWAQEALLADGHARVRPVSGDDARARALLAAEDAARRAGRGIWATRVYGVRRADDEATLNRDVGLLTVVEGKAVRAESRNSVLYLDFGDDWRRDFTVTAASAAVRRLKAEGIDAKALAGRSLRVRGWPVRRFGPQIEITVPAQLEVLD